MNDGTSDTNSRSLGSEYPKQQARCRDILALYKDIGPSGAFAAHMIEATLREADAAAMSGDLVRMIRAFQAMKDIST